MATTRPTVASSEGLKTLMTKTTNKVKDTKWYLHPDLFIFAQYWAGPLNDSNTMITSVVDLNELIDGGLPAAFSYDG